MPFGPKREPRSCFVKYRFEGVFGKIGDQNLEASARRGTKNASTQPVSSFADTPQNGTEFNETRSRLRGLIPKHPVIHGPSRDHFGTYSDTVEFMAEAMNVSRYMV